jgi:hypothetical protein
VAEQQDRLDVRILAELYDSTHPCGAGTTTGETKAVSEPNVHLPMEQAGPKRPTLPRPRARHDEQQLMFGAAAGPVRNKAELQWFCEIILLKQHSKARTPVVKISKQRKWSVGSLWQKALDLVVLSPEPLYQRSACAAWKGQKLLRASKGGWCAQSGTPLHGTGKNTDRPDRAPR